MPAVPGSAAGDLPPAVRDWLLRPWLPAGALTSVTTPPQGFSGAGVFRVRTICGTFALRRWPVGTLPRQRLVGLHDLLHFLRDRGLTFVAAPLRLPGGDSLFEAEGTLWQVEPWLPGAADFCREPSREKLRSAVTALAAWHQQALQWRPPPGTESWFPNVRAALSPAVGERLANLERWERDIAPATDRRSGTASQQLIRLRQLVSSTCPLARAGLKSAADAFVPIQPCLRDVWHDHVLFEGTAVTGLIDPSACRGENVTADIARLLGSLVGDDESAWSFALEVYEQHRPLSIAERRLLTALDRSGVVLATATWLEWLLVRRRTFPDPARVTERLDHLERRLQHLARHVGKDGRVNG